MGKAEVTIQPATSRERFPPKREERSPLAKPLPASAVLIRRALAEGVDAGSGDPRSAGWPEAPFGVEAWPASTLAPEPPEEKAKPWWAGILEEAGCGWDSEAASAPVAAAAAAAAEAAAAAAAAVCEAAAPAAEPPRGSEGSREGGALGGAPDTAAAAVSATSAEKFDAIGVSWWPEPCRPPPPPVPPAPFSLDSRRWAAPVRAAAAAAAVAPAAAAPASNREVLRSPETFLRRRDQGEGRGRFRTP